MHILRFAFVAILASGLLLAFARFILGVLDTLPDEQPATVDFLSHSIRLPDVIGTFVWVLALLIAWVDARRRTAKHPK